MMKKGLSKVSTSLSAFFLSILLTKFRKRSIKVIEEIKWVV